MTVPIGRRCFGGNRLLRMQHVPPDFRQPFIRTGYRPCPSSPQACFLSAFTASNETLNVWTHSLAAALFLWVFGGWLFQADPFTYPLQVYLLSVCLYMLTSCAAHLFQCVSERMHYLCFFCDYAAISLYSLAVGVMYHAYALPSSFVSSPYRRLFVPLCALSSLVCTVLACTARLMDLKLLRVTAFTLHYVYCSLPLLYRCLYCEGADDQECHPRALRYHGYQFALCALTVVVYGTRFPEVLAPGRFDIVGHSHQWFHLVGSLATYYQAMASICDLQHRRSDLISSALPAPTFATTAGLVLAALAVNVAIVAGFTALIWKKEPLRNFKLKKGIPTIGPYIDNNNECQTNGINSPNIISKAKRT